MTVISILGATGQIGRGLALEIAERTSHELVLCARDTEKAVKFTKETLGGREVRVLPLDDLGEAGADVIINAVGDGSRVRQLKLGAELFEITERIDSLATDAIRKKPGAQYFYLSSGAVYGFDAKWPVTEDAAFQYAVNSRRLDDYYPLTKIVTEAKHRGFLDLTIYDIRIFGYFSRFIDPDDGFFLSEVARCVLRGEILKTGSDNMVRDYISQKDLVNLIEVFVANPPTSGPYDIYSHAPVSKFELLDRLARDYELEVSVSDGVTPNYTKTSKPPRPTALLNAEVAGYIPARTSLNTVTEELEHVLAIWNH